MKAVDVIVAIIVVVPIVTALMAVFAFIIGIVVVSIRGGVEGAYAERRHREDARQAHEDVEACVSEDAATDRSHDDEGQGCRPSEPSYFPPAHG